MQSGGTTAKAERDMEQDLRARLDSFHLEVFNRTQAETTKRWTYESEVKRPYYHVTELDEPQLANWRKYLDFEEAEGDYIRTKFLYERCLVTAANYEQFWLRYARWMFAQPEKQEEVRNIYQRASCTYVPISRPTVRLYYAHFEESQARPDVAVAIHEAILMNMPNHVETMISLANVNRRQYGLDSAITTLKKGIESPEISAQTRGALVSEWARLVWKVKGNADEARQIFQGNQQSHLDCAAFWFNWLEFEMQQPTSEGEEPTCYKRVKAVYDDIRKKSGLAAGLIKDLSAMYFVYLRERGGKHAMAEYMRLDQEINGPLSVASGIKGKPSDETKADTSYKVTVLENGHPGTEVNESIISQGGNPYAKYGEQSANGTAVRY